MIEIAAIILLVLFLLSLFFLEAKKDTILLQKNEVDKLNSIFGKLNIVAKATGPENNFLKPSGLLSSNIKYLLLCCFAGLLRSGVSQNNMANKWGNQKIDSLLADYKKGEKDTSKIKVLIKLAYEYNKQGNFTEAEKYIDEALSIAKTNNFPRGEAKSYTLKATILGDMGKYHEAINTLSLSLALWQKLNNKKEVAVIYSKIGEAMREQGNYPEALEMQLAGLKLRQEINDTGEISNSYLNLGVVYYYLNKHDQAIENLLLATKMNEASNNKRGLAVCYNNIGVMYKEMGKYDDGLKYMSLSLQKREELADKKGMANSLGNIGSLYLKKQDYKKALEYYSRAKTLFEEVHNEQGIAYCEVYIGNIYTGLKDYPSAEAHIKTGISKYRNIGIKEYLKNAYLSLVEVDSLRGNFREAFENHKLYSLYKDSLENESNSKKILQAELKFEYEKKAAIEEAEYKREMEKQKEISAEKERRQNIVTSFIIFGLFGTLIFALYVFRSLKISNRQKNLIETQKLEVEKKSLIIEEKNKNITDSILYAKRIQNSLMSSEKYIEKMLLKFKSNQSA